ncbi:MAG: glycerol metabolism activator AgmR [Pseudomonadota bacterium]|jgi:DNA-binding NarL/FixJ family response regulator
MRLLIADDHDLVRDALASHLERVLPGAVVLGAGSVDEALTALAGEGAAGHRVELLLLDLRMPGMNGLDGLGRLRAAHPDCKVALMSGEAGPGDVRGALALGCVGFLPKTLPAGDLVAAIHRMIEGERFVPEGATDSAEPETGGFTRREREVLDYLFKGLSNKEIARALDLEEVTVKLHVRGLCRKLGAKNRTQAAMRAVELGLAR